MKNKFIKPESNNHFKKDDLVICIQNAGHIDEFIIGKEYKVIKSSYNDYDSDVIDIKGENSILEGIFSSRFTTIKLERLKKLKKLYDYT